MLTFSSRGGGVVVYAAAVGSRDNVPRLLVAARAREQQCWQQGHGG
jgi:hypothetical protein